METTFTPGSGLVGGALIGLASALLLLGGGRIAGIGGILGRSLFADGEGRGWRVAFIAGLPLGAGLVARTSLQAERFEIASDPILLVAGGLLVGFGTRLGSGCTSGHGVCGMARGSRRSIVATLTFMTIAALTVFIVRHGLGAGT